MRALYQRRTLSGPTDGNRNHLSICICMILLVAMIVGIFRVEYASVYPALQGSYPTGYLTRHVMGIFAIMLFLFIDGSPETLGLGLFLGAEAVARSIDYHWLTVPYPAAVQHYLFQMGDILRVFFAVQLARIGPKQLWPWIKYGTILTIPYSWAMEHSQFFFDEISPQFRILRDLVGGLVGSWICARVAFAIRNDQLPLRMVALTIASIAFLEAPANILWDVSQHGNISDITRVSLGFFRTMSYYMFTLSAFVNISTIEHRVRALSSAKAEQRVQSIKEEQRVYEAIAKTTQMLAHDVRKPFSLFKAYFDTLSSVKNTEESVQITHNMLIDVQRSLKNVDQLIANIMDIDRDIQTNKRPVLIDRIILSSLEQVFRVSDNKLAKFHYHFRHTGQIVADENQLQRVLTNILENAEQAIRGRRESITFNTHDEKIGGMDFIRLEIQNTGSTISDSDLPNVFDAFFTRGKQHGTGLGLAIVKKIITEHGGEVKVASTPLIGTTFKLLLPSTHIADQPKFLRLPAESIELQIYPLKRNRSNGDFTPVNRAPIANEIKDGNRTSPSTVLIIDDEPAYSRAVEANIGIYLPHAKIVIAENIEDAVKQMLIEKPDLVICDYHFINSDRTGIDMIHQYKDHLPNGIAILHTNHIINSSQLRRAQSIIDIVMAKPLSPLDFAAFMKSKYGESLAKMHEYPDVIILDDESIFIESATKQLQGYHVASFETPTVFEAALIANPKLMNQVGTFIVDNYFGSNEMLGLDFAARLRQRFGSQLNIILYTNKKTSPESIAFVDTVVLKGDNNLLNHVRRRNSA